VVVSTLQNRLSMSVPQLAAQLAALLAKADATAWSPRTDLDWWGAAPVVPEGLAPEVYVDAVSQLFHVAKATLAIASALEPTVAEPTLRALIGHLAADAERHAQAYRGYLERLGDVAPFDPSLAGALSATRSWTGPAWVQLAALAVVLEREHAPALRRAAPVADRLRRQIDVRVAADQARHAELGQLCADHGGAAAGRDERRAAAAYLQIVRARWTDAVAHRTAARRGAPMPAPRFLRLGVA
jgi:hypothetical protein